MLNLKQEEQVRQKVYIDVNVTDSCLPADACPPYLLNCQKQRDWVKHAEIRAHQMSIHELLTSAMLIKPV